MANTNNSLTADIDKALQQLQSFGLFFNKKSSHNLQNTTKNNDLVRINSDVYVTSSPDCKSLAECINNAKFTAMVSSELSASKYRLPDKKDNTHSIAIAFILLSIIALFSVSCWSAWCAICRHREKMSQDIMTSITIKYR